MRASPALALSLAIMAIMQVMAIGTHDRNFKCETLTLVSRTMALLVRIVAIRVTSRSTLVLAIRVALWMAIVAAAIRIEGDSTAIRTCGVILAIFEAIRTRRIIMSISGMAITTPGTVETGRTS